MFRVSGAPRLCFAGLLFHGRRGPWRRRRRRPREGVLEEARGEAAERGAGVSLGAGVAEEGAFRILDYSILVPLRQHFPDGAAKFREDDVAQRRRPALAGRAREDVAALRQERARPRHRRGRMEDTSPQSARQLELGPYGQDGVVGAERHDAGADLAVVNGVLLVHLARGGVIRGELGREAGVDHHGPGLDVYVDFARAHGAYYARLGRRAQRRDEARRPGRQAQLLRGSVAPVPCHSADSRLKGPAHAVVEKEHVVGPRAHPEHKLAEDGGARAEVRRRGGGGAQHDVRRQQVAPPLLMQVLRVSHGLEERVGRR
mmetsp:Transcript_598/g.2137  ORF Transcript_598/g.2137 Transcript_598/m.2137 type:complete len:316 (-) Transcript_598:481-1428(-)